MIYIGIKIFQNGRVETWYLPQDGIQEWYNKTWKGSESQLWSELLEQQDQRLLHGHTGCKRI